MKDKLTFSEKALVQVEFAYGYEKEGTGTVYFPETEKLPLYVSSEGDLCTNMHTEVEDGVARVLLAMADGQFNMAAEAIT